MIKGMKNYVPIFGHCGFKLVINQIITLLRIPSYSSLKCFNEALQLMEDDNYNTTYTHIYYLSL